MIRYNEAKDLAGMTAWKETTVDIHPEYEYVCLKNGKTEKFDNLAAAMKFSLLYERIQVNQAEMNAWRQTYREYEEKATKIWKDALRDEYDYLDDRIFDVAFSKAWEDGHSGGHDEVAYCMIGVVEFVDRILAAK